MGAGRAKPNADTTLRALADFYSDASTPVPVLELLDGQNVPEPYRVLLVHDGDMTPALERFHGGAIHLQVLRCRRAADTYSRDVVLRMDDSKQAVEFGAIEINVGVVDEPARNAILEGRRPLGAILRDFKIAHLSRPKAYFRVPADAVIRRSLELNGFSGHLFGRRNTLLLPNGRVLAEIVEILPP